MDSLRKIALNFFQPRDRTALNHTLTSSSNVACVEEGDLEQAENDKFLEKLFDATLAFLEANQQFREASAPSVFVVYAHDSTEFGSAGQRYVQELIQWLEKVSFKVISDETALHPNIHRTTGVRGVHNIVSTQLCLLPPLRSRTQGETVDTVSAVLLCESEVLEKYASHDYYQNFREELRSYFEQTAPQATLQADTLEQSLRTIVDQRCGDRDFHHVLTELAFLEIRGFHLGNKHGIISVSVDGSSMKPPYISGTDIQKGVLKNAEIEERHLSFFKLLIRLCGDDSPEPVYNPAREFRYKAINIARDFYNSASRRYKSEKLSVGQTAQIFINQERERADGRLTKLHIELRSAGLHQQGLQNQDSDSQKCHRLFKTSAYRDYKDINPLRVDGTCQWALQHPRFINWQRNEHSNLLWISADPGCGKSVLSRSLVDQDLQSYRATICYFFFKDNQA